MSRGGELLNIPNTATSATLNYPTISMAFCGAADNTITNCSFVGEVNTGFFVNSLPYYSKRGSGTVCLLHRGR